VGGNLINVTFNGVKTNLHSIWDTAIPQKAVGNFTQANALSWATNLTSEIKHGQYKNESRTWLQGLDAKDAINSSLVWARDANKYVCTTVLPNGPDAVFGKELSGAYYETAIPVVKKQIAKAGYRLAAWLDAIVEQAEKHGHGQHWKSRSKQGETSETIAVAELKSTCIKRQYLHYAYLFLTSNNNEDSMLHNQSCLHSKPAVMLR
jgi:hypothetical protein